MKWCYPHYIHLWQLFSRGQAVAQIQAAMRCNYWVRIGGPCIHICISLLHIHKISVDSQHSGCWFLSLYLCVYVLFYDKALRNHSDRLRYIFIYVYCCPCCLSTSVLRVENGRKETHSGTACSGIRECWHNESIKRFSAASKNSVAATAPTYTFRCERSIEITSALAYAQLGLWLCMLFTRSDDSCIRWLTYCSGSLQKFTQTISK